jgi:hypothetical protein
LKCHCSIQGLKSNTSLDPANKLAHRVS